MNLQNYINEALEIVNEADLAAADFAGNGAKFPLFGKEPTITDNVCDVSGLNAGFAGLDKKNMAAFRSAFPEVDTLISENPHFEIMPHGTMILNPTTFFANIKGGKDTGISTYCDKVSISGLSFDAPVVSFRLLKPNGLVKLANCNIKVAPGDRRAGGRVNFVNIPELTNCKVDAGMVVFMCNRNDRKYAQVVKDIFDCLDKDALFSCAGAYSDKVMDAEEFYAKFVLDGKNFRRTVVDNSAPVHVDAAKAFKALGLPSNGAYIVEIRSELNGHTIVIDRDSNLTIENRNW